MPTVVMGKIVTSLPSTVTVGAVAEKAVIQAEDPMADVVVVDEEEPAGAGQRRSGIKTWLTSAMILPSRRTQVICIISLMRNKVKESSRTSTIAPGMLVFPHQQHMLP